MESTANALWTRPKVKLRIKESLVGKLYKCIGNILANWNPSLQLIARLLLRNPFERQ
jgi:hypothetical protein